MAQVSLAAHCEAHPERAYLLREWFSKDLAPAEVYYASTRRLPWACEACGLRWDAAPRHRLKAKVKEGCQHGTLGQRQARLKKAAPLEETHPELFADLAPDQALSPGELYAASELPVLWRCPAGHIYSASCSSRRRGRGCPLPACQGARIGEKARARGRRSHEEVLREHPRLLREWAVEENLPLTPGTPFTLTRTPLWWRGEACRHLWQETLANRLRGYGCPYCSHRRLLSGFNDLATLYPQLARDWHPRLNQPLTASQVAPHAKELVWWLGSCGHAWRMAPGSLVAGCRCPVCPRYVSSGEGEVRTFLEGAFPGLYFERTRRVLPRGKELDLYAPALKRAVEYNGDWWHAAEGVMAALGPDAARERHEEKLAACASLGIALAYVWESDWRERRGLVEEALTVFMETGALAPCLRRLA